MVLMVDTTAKHIGKAIAEELLCSGENAGIIYTGDGEYAISNRKTWGFFWNFWKPFPERMSIQGFPFSYKVALRRETGSFARKQKIYRSGIFTTSHAPDDGIGIQNPCEKDVSEGGGSVGMQSAAG